LDLWQGDYRGGASQMVVKRIKNCYENGNKIDRKILKVKYLSIKTVKTTTKPPGD
jgi:hypothetical protein